MGTSRRKKKKKKMPVHSLTMAHLASLGFKVDLVERWIPHCFIKKDAFGMGDYLAYVRDKSSPYFGIWLIQATSAANHSARVKKCKANEHLAGWTSDGLGRFAVLSFKAVADGHKAIWEELKAA